MKTVLLLASFLTQDAPSPAAKAFEELQAELRALQPSTPVEWDEKLSEFLGKAKGRLSAFAAQFPGTDEGFEARFQLAEIAAQAERDLKGGARILREILQEVGKESPKRDLRARALLSLAQLLKEDKDTAGARQQFQTIREEFPGSPYEFVAKDALQEMETAAKLAPGNPLLPFEVADLEGRKLSPKAFEGKVLLLDFWATWCPPCRAELPHVKEAYAAFREKGFEILGVSLDRDREKLQRFLKAQELGWPQVFDGKEWESELAKLYSIRSLPATFLADRKGKIRYRNLRGEELKRRVAELIAEGT